MDRAFFVLIALASLSVSPFAYAVPPLPPPPSPGYPVLPALETAEEGAADTWLPMRETAPVSAIRLNGCVALRMPCNFHDTTLERASWDRSAALDLSLAQGLQFQFYCADPTPVSGFTFYLRSGSGWYSIPFAPQTPGQWETISVDKMAMQCEDKPAGWARINRIRISAWRGSDLDTEFYVADFGIVGAASPIVVVKAEETMIARPDASQTVQDVSQLISRYLTGLGLPFAALSDLDLSDKNLSEAKLVVLPYNPAMSTEAEDCLERFLGKGGKVVAFYHLPAGLAPLLGMGKGTYRPEAYNGQFASIRQSGTGLYGMPEAAGQRSWNISERRPVDGQSAVAAEWYDEQGQPTGCAAVLVSDTGIYMSHILLRDDPRQKRLLLLSMIGHFLPECWRQSAQAHLEEAGAFGPYRSLAEAETAIRSNAPRPQTLAILDEAVTLRTQADAALRQKRYPEALAMAFQARQQMVDAYCAAQRPEKGEHRAFWCHDAFGVASMTWDEAIANLARNGFTAILPNMLWGGVAYYESEVLPVAPEVAERGDQVAACLAACRKYGIECHVWKVNWNMGSRAPQSFVDRMKAEKRTQVRFDGAAKDRWLCPSHPANQQLEIQAMLEVAAKYEVDGLHFDYIRYPDSQSCYCEGCRKRFEEAAGKKIAEWPNAVVEDEGLRQQWLDFRRSQITHVVAAVCEGARSIRPGVKISAAVFRTWPKDRDTVGQDWKLWCDKGYLDFVCPMDYTPHNVQFANLVQQQRAWAGKVSCYPGIGLSVWPEEERILKLIDQITLTRQLKTGGFTVFNYGLAEARDILPRCAMGITRSTEGAVKGLSGNAKDL